MIQKKKSTWQRSYPRSWRHRFGYKFVTAHSDAVVESFRRIVTISFSFLFQSLTWCSCEWTRNYKNSRFFSRIFAGSIWGWKNYLFLVWRMWSEKLFFMELTQSGSYQNWLCAYKCVWRHLANSLWTKDTCAMGIKSMR